MTERPPRPLIGDQNGAAMRTFRRRRELTVRQVCDLLKEREGITIHPNSLRNAETNARGASDQLIGAYARVLGVPKDALYRVPLPAVIGAGDQ